MPKTCHTKRDNNLSPINPLLIIGAMEDDEDNPEKRKPVVKTDWTWALIFCGAMLILLTLVFIVSAFLPK